jgi:hypothetical protein
MSEQISKVAFYQKSTGINELAIKQHVGLD